MEENRYEEIVRTYGDMVYRVACSYTKSHYDAEDAMQNVFCKLLTKNMAFKDEEHVKKWLIRVTINECKNMLVTFWRKKVVSWDENPVEQIFSTQEKSELYEAVMQLPAKYRVVIHLFYYEGYSTREIGELMHLKEAAVRTRLVRGRKILKKELKEAWQDEEE